MARLLQICLFFAAQASVGAEVFVDKARASQVFSRSRRANTPFEEFRQGNIERECHEERCSYEEAREVFENTERTDEFWNVYFDGDACTSQPCLNRGKCKDGIGAYSCLCETTFQGKNCEIEIPKLCENNNGGCQHFCKVVDDKVTCSCATGYYLDEDRKKCLSDKEFPCGVLKTSLTRTSLVDTDFGNDTEILNSTITPDTEEPMILSSANSDARIVNGNECLPGHCPWQALLINEEGVGFCGGTILTEHIILSAAHCMRESKSFTVRLGDYDTEKTDDSEETYPVEKVIIHNKYVTDTYDNDIAIIKLKEPIKFTKFIIPACLPEKDFAEKVLMKQNDAQISGFGRTHERGRQSTILQKLTVPYVDRLMCIESSQAQISANMFCAGYDKVAKDACQGDSGGPHVTQYKDTWFITGIVSWGEGCAREGKYGVYTQVSKFLPWIKAVIKPLYPTVQTAPGRY
uniref:coagulation factor Xa n=1 Tax=Lepisosteus oculatus TaxID=7918 RepID=W5MUA0_LEPOC